MKKYIFLKFKLNFFDNLDNILVIKNMILSHTLGLMLHAEKYNNIINNIIS